MHYLHSLTGRLRLVMVGVWLVGVAMAVMLVCLWLVVVGVTVGVTVGVAVRDVVFGFWLVVVSGGSVLSRGRGFGVKGGYRLLGYGGQRETERERESEKESVCVYVCVLIIRH